MVVPKYLNLLEKYKSICQTMAVCFDSKMKLKDPIAEIEKDIMAFDQARLDHFQGLFLFYLNSCNIELVCGFRNLITRFHDNPQKLQHLKLTISSLYSLKDINLINVLLDEKFFDITLDICC